MEQQSVSLCCKLQLTSSISHCHAMSHAYSISLTHFSLLPLFNLPPSPTIICPPLPSSSPSAPQFFVSFFQQFPYSLPCLINAVLCLIGLLAAIFLLPETLNKKLVLHSLNLCVSNMQQWHVSNIV